TALVQDQSGTGGEGVDDVGARDGAPLTTLDERLRKAAPSSRDSLAYRDQAADRLSNPTGPDA
ncbi:hypothetical protein ACFQ07_27340, partial [Actinomadura adrarensis]